MSEKIGEWKLYYKTFYRRGNNDPGETKLHTIRIGFAGISERDKMKGIAAEKLSEIKDSLNIIDANLVYFEGISF